MHRNAGRELSGPVRRAAGAAAVAVAVVDTALAGSTAPWAALARRGTKPALVPAVAAAVRASGGRPSRALGAALTGSWAGDVALLSRSEAGLLGGVGGFAVAHLGYLADIRRHAATAPRRTGPGTGGAARAGAGAVFAAVFAGSAAVLWRRLDTPAERRLRVPVLGYAALVTGMGAAAVRAGLRTPGRTGWSLAAGGATFVVSDGLVALARFGPGRSRLVEAAVMATYATAQGLLAGALADRPGAAHQPGRG